MGRLTDDQVMELLRSESPLNKARAKFSGWCGRIEQEGMQRRPPGPIEIRRMEFEAVKDILEAYQNAKPDATPAGPVVGATSGVTARRDGEIHPQDDITGFEFAFGETP